MKSWFVEPSPPLTGTIVVPGDKSISHRAVMLGAPEIRGLLESEDVKATREVVAGRSTDCGNSGTTIRLLMGLFASRPGEITLTGDESLRRRPMERVAAPLRKMGADIVTSDGKPPVRIRGASLTGQDITIDVASAQVKSALLLAGLQAKGTTTIRMPAASRDHTERMFEHFGVKVLVEDEGRRVSIHGGQKLTPRDVDVPGDISSAAFPIAAALLVRGSRITITNLGLNPLRTGIVDLLSAYLGISNHRETSNEPRADVMIGSATPAAIAIEGDIVPRLIDEIPIMALVAAHADADESVVRDAKELRVKETDRIEAIVGEFASIGLSATATADGLIIPGRQKVSGGTVRSRGDHRIAMMGAVAGMISGTGVTIEDVGCVETSFPGFSDLFRSMGANIRER